MEARKRCRLPCCVGAYDRHRISHRHLSVIDALLKKPIPFDHGERFVSVLGASLDDPDGMSALTLKDALEYQQQTGGFDLFGWFVFADYNLTAPGQPQHLPGVLGRRLSRTA
jgi:hypothetical protein